MEGAKDGTTRLPFTLNGESLREALLLTLRNDEGPRAKLAWMPRLVVDAPGRRFVVDGELPWYRRWELPKDGIGGKSKREDGEIIKERRNEGR